MMKSLLRAVSAGLLVTVAGLGALQASADVTLKTDTRKSTTSSRAIPFGISPVSFSKARGSGRNCGTSTRKSITLI